MDAVNDFFIFNCNRSKFPLNLAPNEQGMYCNNLDLRQAPASMIADQNSDTLRQEEEFRRREDDEATRRAKEQAERASGSKKSHDQGLPARDAIKFLKGF